MGTTDWGDNDIVMSNEDPITLVDDDVVVEVDVRDDNKFMVSISVVECTEVFSYGAAAGASIIT